MNQRKNTAAGRGLYMIAAAALCGIGIVGAVIMQARRNAVEVEPASAQAPVVVDVVPKTEPTTPKPIPQPEVKEEFKAAVQTEVIDAPEELLPQVISPLDGTTVTVFSTSELIYDTTMADWRTHAGIDIQAAQGDAVKTAASGEVLSVSFDELMGHTVVIDHGSGYTTQYSSLMEVPPVSAGQKVSAGDVIGYVGDSAAAEVDMGPHLHFSVSKDGQVIDPADYVN